MDPDLLGIPTYFKISPKEKARDLRTIQQKLDADKARLKGNTNTLIQLIHAHRLAVVQSKVTDALQYETDDGRHFDRVADCIEDAQNGLTDAQM